MTEIKSDLVKEVKAKVALAVRKKIWKRAYQIVKALGKKEQKVESWYTTTSYDLIITFADGHIAIHLSNYVMGGEYMHISFGEDGCVFDAREVTSESDKNLPYQIGKDGIFIQSYLPGAWENLLNLKKLEKIMANQKRSIAAKEGARRRKEEQARPLNEAERKLMENFGLEK